jgi:phage repressor protein C with HTH and peptisase S24 domain
MGKHYHRTVIDCNTTEGFHQMVKIRSNLGMEKADIRRANLRILINELAEGNGTKFAEMVGKKQSYISDVLRGKKSFGEKVARSIEVTLGLHKESLDKPPSDHVELEAGPDLPAHYRKLPVVGTAQLGPDGHWIETGYPVGKGEGYVEFVSRDENAYVLRVKGQSMAPAIRNGWLVVIEPNANYVPTSLVLVCTVDGRCMVKEYLYEREGEVGLGSVNDAFGRITLQLSEIEKIHPVAAIIPPIKFKPW